MKIFVTGASGFVGGAAVRQLLKDHEIIAMSRSKSSDEVIAKLGATPVRCELGTVTTEHLHGIDAVLHCAAYVEEWGPIKNFERMNIEGTRQLLEQAKAAGVKRFIHISTEAVLFKGQNMCQINESYPLATTSPYPYSRTKALAEQLVTGASGIETITLRPRMIWGVGDLTILPKVIEMHEAGQFAWIDGGEHLTSSTNIINLVHGIKLALTQGQVGAAYFLTDGPPMRFRDFMTRYAATQDVTLGNRSMPGWLIRAIAAVAETLWKAFRVKSPPPLTRFSANILSRECTLNDDRARNQLGYLPVVSVDQGLDICSQQTP